MNNNFTFNQRKNYENNLKKEKPKPKKIIMKKSLTEEYKKNLKPEDNYDIPFKNLTLMQKLKRIWKNKKYKAIFQLTIYSIFILIIIIIVNVMPKNEIKEDKKEEETRMYENISTNHSYSINLSYSEEDLTHNYLYTGSVILKENVGTRGYDEEVINYSIKDNLYYKIDEENEYILTTEEDLFVIDKSYLDYDNINSYIEKGKLDYTTTYTNGVIVEEYKVYLKDILLDYKEEDYFTIITYKSEDLKIKIDYTNLINKIYPNITKINVEIDYTNIGSVKDFSK